MFYKVAIMYLSKSGVHIHVYISCTCMYNVCTCMCVQCMYMYVCTMYVHVCVYETHNNGLQDIVTPFAVYKHVLSEGF